MFKRTKKEIINSILKIKNLSDEDCKDLNIFENRFKSIIDDIDNSYREFCNAHSKLCNTIKKLAKEISYVKNDMSNEEIKDYVFTVEMI